MALIRVDKKSGAVGGSLEAAGIVVGKWFFNDFDGTGPSGLDDIPLTGYTPAGTQTGCVVANLGQAYSNLAIVNDNATVISAIKSDGTLVAQSSSMDVSDVEVLIAEWGRSSTRPTFTFTPKS